MLAACGRSGSSSVRAIRIANLARRAPEMNHLWPLMHPLVAVLDGRGVDERRVGAGDLGLGHREARPGHALAERPQVLLLLLVGAPVQQRVHVALVGRLAVEDERPVVRPSAASACTMASSTWPSPMPPHSSGMCGSQSPSANACLRRPQRADVGLAVDLVGRSSPMRSSVGADHVVDERADPAPDLLELGGQGEVDAHGSESVTPPLPGEPGALPRLGVRSAHRRGGARRLSEEDLGASW